MSDTATSTEQPTIEQFMQQQNDLDLLRFITCGSVDDGKSTLIGRLLYEAKCIFDDQVTSLKQESITMVPKAVISILLCSLMALPQNVNKVLRLMSLIVSLIPTSVSLLWPTPQVMSSIPVIW